MLYHVYIDVDWKMEISRNIPTAIAVHLSAAAETLGRLTTSWYSSDESRFLSQAVFKLVSTVALQAKKVKHRKWNGKSKV